MQMQTRKRLLAAFMTAMCLGAGATLYSLAAKAADSFDPLSGLTLPNLPTLTGWAPTVNPTTADVSFWVRGQLGGRAATSSLQVAGFAVSETTARELTAGIGTGADYRIGNFVVGTFADFDARIDHASGKLAGVNVLLPLGDVWTVGGRVGWFATKSLMIYTLGGYSGLTERKIDTAAGTFASGHRNGYVAGGGLEFPLGPVFGTVEYRHMYLDTLAVPGTAASSKSATDTVRFGIGYRFGVN